MTAAEPSRTVTRRRCVACELSFNLRRKDARYCSAACRQSAARARAGRDSLSREIDEAKARYWALVLQQAQARVVAESDVMTEQAQFVDSDGRVYIGGKLVGRRGRDPDCRCSHCRLGWATWGLEAAGAPFASPADWVDAQVRGESAC